MAAGQGKYFQKKRDMAPYRRPMSSASVKNPGILNKLKSFFVSNDNDSKQEGCGFKRRHLVSDESPSVLIPGSFLTSKDVSSIILPKRQETPKVYDSITRVDSIDEEMEKDDSMEDDGSYNADVSNAKLADFFSRKGGEPLNEVEMEGVNTLMRKSSRTRRSSRTSFIPNTSLNHNDPADMVYSRVVRRSGTPSLAAQTTRAPSFNPKYDTSLGSRSFSNASKGPVSSRRRIFNYSSLPSPYRTTVYKYSAADNYTADKEVQDEESGVSGSMTCNPGGGKKLSNTASALVSLLDHDSSKDETSNQLANPYSSHVNHLRRYKRSLPMLPALKQEVSKDTPVKSSPIQELGKVQAKPNGVTSKFQRYNSGDKYRPMKPSSLRSNVLKASESPERKTPTKGAEPEVPRALTFNFSFQSKDKCQSEVGSYSRPQESTPRPEYAFKFHPQKLVSSANASSDLAREVPNKLSNGHSAASTLGVANLSSPQYDFGQIAPSNVDPNAVDNEKVQEFKTLFAF